MTVNKRKKVTRQHGSKTHGWGSKKKHRGSGNRGGTGMAGSGKRADHKKPTIIKEFGLSSYFGKRGFKIPPEIKRVIKPINIKDIPNKDEINLNLLGYNKLLSKGKVKRKMKIIVEYCSKKAKEKIEKQGGEIILTKK